MKVGFPGGPRLEWYDRNPQHRLEVYYVIDVAPHATIQRWTYTVPSGKKAFLEAVFAMLYRGAVATTEGLAYANVALQPSGEAVKRILVTIVRTNNKGDRDRADVGQGPILLPGDTLSGHTADGSTGGTFDYHVAMKITEFDA